MSARDPDDQGYVTRDDVSIHYEVFGHGEPTVLLLPTWSIVHSAAWRAQAPDLARHCRVVTFDGRGNGQSSRPESPAAYTDQEFASDALAVLDAIGEQRAVIVSHSKGAHWGLLLAAEHPERIAGAVFICPQLPIPQNPADQPVGPTFPFTKPLATEEGWAKFNQRYWLKDYRGFLEFFFTQVCSDAHSLKQIEDCVRWGLETTPETLIATVLAPHRISQATVEEFAHRVRCPTLVIHGTDDHVVAPSTAETLARWTKGSLVMIEGGGHAPQARDPVKVNLLLREFIKPQTPRRSAWQPVRKRPLRALYISSPIGLGHARRDLAIANELRTLRPDLQIDWLAQHPVTQVLATHHERIHPASALLASESRHLESYAAEHSLHIFQSYREMDTILTANYMLFHDVARETPYDLWIGDEAWELDYFLHENPEEKIAPFAWLTDFVGALPVPEGGEREATVVADFNAEMIEHVERSPHVRDRAIFVGDPDDIPPLPFGPGLPAMREWTEPRYDFCGYITGFDMTETASRETLRARLGYQPDEQVCVVAVGGSGVGDALLRRVIAAYPEAKRRVPALRMVVVAGPRIDPASLPSISGVETHGYIPDLHQSLAACDLAIVQGGLMTCMELTAAKRPFLYFPLRHHFEQQYLVPHRLERYGAGRRMEYDTASPEIIAAAIVEELGRAPRYRDITPGGAARAAARIAELL